jgi:hypothetical protein
LFYIDRFNIQKETNMSIKAFLGSIKFKPYGSVINSWDSFSESGSVLMQLWQEKGQRIKDINYPVEGAYLRVKCFDSKHYDSVTNENGYKVGYAGRQKAIEDIAKGAKGYAAISSPPNEQRGPGLWSKYADLTKVYPILSVEHDDSSKDIFVVLGRPVAAEGIA